MPKTTFVRKPCNLDEVLAGAKWIERHRKGFPIDSYYVAREVQLEEDEFFALHKDLVSEREWIQEFSNQAQPMKGDAVAAIRVTCPGSPTVLIIDPQGYNYPCYVGLESEE